MHISGRAANVNDAECAPEVSTVTRWTIGGSGSADTQVPPAPFFGLGLGVGGGAVELSGVSFTGLTNTNSISSGTLTLYYWDETQGTPLTLLASGITADDQTLTLIVPGAASAGSMLQIENEILRVVSTSDDGTQYAVTRGVDGTTPAIHSRPSSSVSFGESNRDCSVSSGLFR